MTHETHTMLALNTNHVSEVTCNFLNENARATESETKVPEIIVYSKTEYGWFVPMIEWDDPLINRIPDDLLTIFKFARAHGYTWLMFDCDVEPMDELPWFQW